MKRVSNKSLGSWIRAAHFGFPGFALTVTALGEANFVSIVVLFTIATSVLFVLLGDCFVHVYESYLMDDDVCGVDIVLEALGLDLTLSNRYWSSIYIAAAYYIILALIIEYRFAFFSAYVV